MAGIERTYQVDAKIENRTMAGRVQLSLVPIMSDGTVDHAAGNMSVYVTAAEASGIACGSHLLMTLSPK